MSPRRWLLALGCALSLAVSPGSESHACLNGPEGAALQARMAAEEARLDAAQASVVRAATALGGLDFSAAPTPEATQRLQAAVRAYNGLGAVIRAQDTTVATATAMAVAMAMLNSNAVRTEDGYDVFSRALRWVRCDYATNFELCLGVSRAMLEHDFELRSADGLRVVRAQLARDVLPLLATLRGHRPGDHRLFGNLGTAYEHLGLYAEASGAYRASSALDPRGHDGEERVHAMVAWFRHLRAVDPRAPAERLLEYPLDAAHRAQALADLERMRNLGAEDSVVDALVARAQSLPAR